MVYILRTLISEAMGLAFELTSDINFFKSANGPKINYSGQAIENCIQIIPHTILFDHGIRDYQIQVNAHSAYEKLFFKNAKGTIPFDFFGASFWLLSRYEEYLPFKGDKFNRFHYKSSLAYQYDFLHLPLVNIWLSQVKLVLKKQYPELEIVEREYNFISTIDIDNVYKYKFKGFVRTIAGFLTDKNFKERKQRLKIILNKERDPFDCYDFLIETHTNTGVQAIYFILLGDYGKNDKNHSANDLRFQSLIKQLADYSIVGIHPSYGSNDNLRQLKVETARLGNIIHRLILKTRQHFAMLKFPNTYKDLLQAGFFSDYSMGYTNKNGFRASYCYPYKWYSLDIESVSSLSIHSFCISENTLLVQKQKEHKSLVELSEPYVNEVKKYGGEMISVFHNDNFNATIKKFYLDFLIMAKA